MGLCMFKVEASEPINLDWRSRVQVGKNEKKRTLYCNCIAIVGWNLVCGHVHFHQDLTHKVLTTHFAILALLVLHYLGTQMIED